MLYDHTLVFRHQKCKIFSFLSEDDKSSLSKHNFYRIIEGNKFSAQWYENNEALYKLEFTEMKKIFPQAELNVLPDDRLCWKLNFNEVLDATGNRHSWDFMFVYDTNYPYDSDNRGAIKVYLLKPSVNELITLALDSGKDNVPCIILDNTGSPILDLNQGQTNKQIISAIIIATQAASWAAHFQLGLTDNYVWSKFCEH